MTALDWIIVAFTVLMALWGYSQGGLHTNLTQAWSRDRRLNPLRVRFRALMPGNTPDRIFDAY